MDAKRQPQNTIENVLEYTIFASRWLQAPLYLGLIAVQCVYTYKFIIELAHILSTAPSATEMQILLGILSLVDVTMVANLVAMVIIGGYATFVSKLHLFNHADKPDWLDHIDPGTIKIKLASSLIGISSIHLLRSFIDIQKSDMEQLRWQVIIHIAFVISTVLLAVGEYVMAKKHALNGKKH